MLVLVKIMAGLSILIVDGIFAVWASIGQVWYMYLLNFVLLFIASAMINTSFIQGIARGYSFFYLFGFKGLPKAIGINILTIILFTLAYLISNYVLINFIQTISFFVACIVLSALVAISDKQFQVAIERTKAMEGIIPKTDY